LLVTKPFSIPSAGQRRGPDGKFVKLEAAPPPEVLDETIEQGVSLTTVLRSVSVPDRETGRGAPKNVASPGAKMSAPVFPDSIPWPASGPVNDAGKLPFKLK
jgi:hypothetical protein